MEASKRVARDPVPPKEDALTPELRRKQREAWLKENREAIEAYNEHVRRHGVFSTGLRGF